MKRIKELVVGAVRYWFINGWKVDCVILKSKWKPALLWLPHAILLSSLAVGVITQSIDYTLSLFIVGCLSYGTSLMVWQTKAYAYIMEKEGIGKKPDTGDKPETGKQEDK